MQIGPFQATKSERAKVKVKVRLNLHGIVSVEGATVSVLWNACDCSCSQLIFVSNSLNSLMLVSAFGRRRG